MGVQPALRIHGLEALCLIILHLWHKNQAALGYFAKCCRKKGAWTSTEPRELEQEVAWCLLPRVPLALVTCVSLTHTQTRVCVNTSRIGKKY